MKAARSPAVAGGKETAEALVQQAAPVGHLGLKRVQASPNSRFQAEANLTASDVGCGSYPDFLPYRFEAAMRADECLAAGDMEGEAVWFRIGKAIEELGAREKPRGATTH